MQVINKTLGRTEFQPDVGVDEVVAHALNQLIRKLSHSEGGQKSGGPLKHAARVQVQRRRHPEMKRDEADAAADAKCRRGGDAAQVEAEHLEGTEHRGGSEAIRHARVQEQAKVGEAWRVV